MEAPIDKFGAFFVQNLRDRMLHDLDMLLQGGWKAPAVQDLQKKIAGFSDAEKEVVRSIAEHMVTTGMHDLLFAIQEQADAGASVRVLVDGQEVAKLSDGLHGEIFTDEGWIQRFSKYPNKNEG